MPFKKFVPKRNNFAPKPEIKFLLSGYTTLLKMFSPKNAKKWCFEDKIWRKFGEKWRILRQIWLKVANS